jgi:hypothetical protein
LEQVSFGNGGLQISYPPFAPGKFSLPLRLLMAVLRR